MTLVHADKLVRRTIPFLDSIKESKGLDPAGPLYINVAPEHHLDAGDAAHVQVIHTNGGTLGWRDDLGDIDFYPNGGSKQEGCGLDLI
ncbi:unnamed protein product, partial [Timema podura]|nr:unnamed protein product [Timema podura]